MMPARSPGKTDGVAKRRSLRGYVRMAVIAAGLAIPTLSLIPLGTIWLWQKGYLLHWAVGVCIATAIAWGIQRFLIAEEPEAEPSRADDTTVGHTPIEEAAWKEVEAVAGSASPAALQSHEAALALGIDVTDRVARIMRPGIADPVWHFTAPEGRCSPNVAA